METELNVLAKSGIIVAKNHNVKHSLKKIISKKTVLYSSSLPIIAKTPLLCSTSRTKRNNLECNV